MNKTTRLFSVVSCTTLGVFYFSIPAVATEKNDSPKSSIRISDKTKEADYPSLAKISFEQALKAALGAAPGNVIKGELEEEDDSLVYTFEIIGADKEVTEVEIDAGDGKVLATETKQSKKKGNHAKHGRHDEEKEDKKD